jgi:uncharacterized membrane protein
MDAETRRRRPRGAAITIALASLSRVVAALFRERVGWLMPLFIGLAVVALIISVISVAGPLAPFIYPLL